jgi:hypothetical protein
MNRFGAFAVHLGISLIIFIIIGYLILFHWYPDFFFASDGGWQGIRIVAFVDLVLGPVLTLVVFNKAKPASELRRDLSIIATIQFVCLTAGVWVVFSERPIAMVFADGSFQSMTADDYIEAGADIPELEGPSPHWVTLMLPSDLGDQSEIRRQAINDRRPLKTLAQYYVPFDVSHIDPSRHGITDFEIERIGMGVFNDFLAENGGTLEEYRFLPFGTRYVPALIAFKVKTEEVLFMALPLTFLSEVEPNQS